MDLNKWLIANGVQCPDPKEGQLEPDRKIRIIFKSGESIAVLCREYEIKRRFFGRIEVRKIEGIKETMPLYIRNSEIVAVVEE
jgi:hypothetical protein